MPHTYQPTTPKQAVDAYIYQSRKKKAVLLLATPPLMMLGGYLFFPAVLLYDELFRVGIMASIGIGFITIYFAAKAILILGAIAWIPCAIYGTFLLLTSRKAS